MIFAFLAQNEHGRALIALIRAMRACAACFPELYITCELHRAELDRLYPEHCPDANCPACAADRPPVERVPDEPPADPRPWEKHIPNPHPPANCGPLTLRLPDGATCPTCGTVVHDNGDYRDPKPAQNDASDDYAACCGDDFCSGLCDGA